MCVLVLSTDSVGQRVRFAHRHLCATDLEHDCRRLQLGQVAEVRQLCNVWLTLCGFAVEEARDGAEAVRKAQARPPDLILMDLAMPVLDGISATKALKAHPLTAPVPVLALSANVWPPTMEKALQAGCEVFVAKPVELDQLVEHLRAAFRRVHDGPLPHRAPPE